MSLTNLVTHQSPCSFVALFDLAFKNCIACFFVIRTDTMCENNDLLGEFKETYQVLTL